MKKRLSSIGVAVWVLAVAVNAAELGRIDLQQRPGAVIRQPVDGFVETRFALEGRLDFTSYDWDIGDASFDYLSIAPQVIGSYGVTDQLDLRISLQVTHLKDDRIDVGDGILMSPAFSLVRLGAGARLWGNRQGLFPIYVDAQINYFVLDGKDIDIRSPMASLSGGFGTGYTFEEGVTVLFGLTVETSIKDADTRFNGVDRDLSMSGIGLGIGVQYAF